MKKIYLQLFPLILGFTLSFLPTFPTFADVIFAPSDLFWVSHEDECTYLNRSYVTAGSKGVVKMYHAPNSGLIKGIFKNGQKINMSWQWEDWYFSGTGWYHKEDLSLFYDTIAFLEDHETTDFDNAENYSVPEVQMYLYPNSGICYTMKESPDYSTIGEALSHLYVDEQGLRWGYISYYMTSKGWVCLDDPSNPNLNSGFVPESPSVSQLRGHDAITPSMLLVLALSSLIVGGIVYISLKQLKKIQKKKQLENGDEMQ